MGYDVRTRRTLVHVLVRLNLHVYRDHMLRHLINVTSVFPRIPRSQLIDVTSVFVGITQSTEKSGYNKVVKVHERRNRHKLQRYCVRYNSKTQTPLSLTKEPVVPV